MGSFHHPKQLILFDPLPHYVVQRFFQPLFCLKNIIELRSTKQVCDMALIINIESTTDVCSVALGKDGEVLDYRENRDGRNHASLLTVYIEELLKAHAINANRLDAVAVSGGPGSYTGLRIGVSAAKGICFAAGIPLIAISPLQAMAHHVSGLPDVGTTLLCPMIDARRMEVYSALYDSNNNIVDNVQAEIIDENTYSDILNDCSIAFFGNGSEKCQPFITHKNAFFLPDIHTSARFLVSLSERAFQNNLFEDTAYYEPFYLKDFVATKPKNQVLKK